MNTRIVLLDCPYLTLRDNELAEKYFGKIFSLRLNGFLKHYQHSYPFSADDFLCDHVLIEIDDELVAEYKLVPYNRCKERNLGFPILETMKNSAPQYYENLQEHLKTVNTQNVCYMGAFCAIPNKRQLRLVRNLIALSGKKYMEEHNMEEVYLTATDLSYKFFSMCGFNKVFDEPFEDQKIQTPVFAQKMTEFSPMMWETIKGQEHFWTNKLHIASTETGLSALNVNSA